MREKSTHIDQLLKERESDREDMQTQSMLFQKNVSLVIMRVAVLLFSLLDLLGFLRVFNLYLCCSDKEESVAGRRGTNWSMGGDGETEKSSDRRSSTGVSGMARKSRTSLHLARRFSSLGNFQ